MNSQEKPYSDGFEEFDKLVTLIEKHENDPFNHGPDGYGLFICGRCQETGNYLEMITYCLMPNYDFTELSKKVLWNNQEEIESFYSNLFYDHFEKLLLKNPDKVNEMFSNLLCLFLKETYQEWICECEMVIVERNGLKEIDYKPVRKVKRMIYPELENFIKTGDWKNSQGK